MALTRVSGRVVYPHGEDTPTPVTGDGVIEYVHATPGVIGEAVHGPDRHRIEYTDGVAGEAWLKAGMWRAYVYPSEGRSYTLHLGIPEDGDVTLADVVGEVVPDGIVTRGEQGPPGASVTGAVDNGDQTVSFTLSDGTETAPVTIPPGPAGVGIESISDPDADSRVTVTYSDGSAQTVRAIRGAPGGDGHTPIIEWAGTALVIDGETGPDLRGEKGEKGDPGDDGADSTVPGPAGPPGAVPTGDDYLVVGPGRPDAPSTTGLTASQVNALPVGCEYRSTDGSGTGAWVWQKRPTGWDVTVGDTGWRDVTALGSSTYWNTADPNHLVRVKVLASGLALQLSLMAAGSERIRPIPLGLGSFTGEYDAVTQLGGGNPRRLIGQSIGLATVEQPTTGLYRTLRSIPHPPGFTWPTTLPGTNV